MEKHEVVVIGGGHNGLIVAAYLAKAGVDVCIIERLDVVGGGVRTEESTLPGFKHDPFSIEHGLIQSNPIISRDELGLKSKYGLKYLTQDPGYGIIFPDDSALFVYHDMDKTCESISQFSERDAEVFPKFAKACENTSKILEDFMSSPPPDFGNMISFMEASEEGQEYLKLIMESALDVAEDWFESEQMRVALIRNASEIMLPPQQKGTGNFVSKFPIASTWASIAEGGSGRLAEVLSACIEDNGGTIKVSSPVKAVKVEGGEARGVILDSGEEIMATKAVISGLNVKQLFCELLRPEELPATFPDRIKRTRPSVFVGMKQDIALNEAPKYKAGGDADKALTLQISPFLEDLLRMFEELAYGIPRVESPLMGVTSLIDPTRAPEGKHTLYLYHYEPYDLKDGGPSRWDEIKEEIADGFLGTLSQHTTNMGPENILGRFIRTPLDLERYNPAWIAGDFNHMGIFLSQLFANRPLPGWGHYRTPVSKLYMCGPSTHPGPAVSGGGRAAVQVVMEDLGIDFKKAISK
ncbi:phytoene desaturase family protein [Chloroflexota bacterium]